MNRSLVQCIIANVIGMHFHGYKWKLNDSHRVWMYDCPPPTNLYIK